MNGPLTGDIVQKLISDSKWVYRAYDKDACEWLAEQLNHHIVPSLLERLAWEVFEQLKNLPNGKYKGLFDLYIENGTVQMKQMIVTDEEKRVL